MDVLCCPPQAWLRGSSTLIHPGGGGRNGDLILQRILGSSFLLSSQVARQRALLINQETKPVQVFCTSKEKLQDFFDVFLNKTRSGLIFFFGVILCCRGEFLFWIFFFIIRRAGFGAEERGSAVIRWQQLRGPAEGGVVGQAGGCRPPGFWGRFKPEWLHRKPEPRLPDQKGLLFPHPQIFTLKV